MGQPRERPEIRADWRFDQGGGGGEFTERVYFRRFACTLRGTLTPDKRHGSWVANVFIGEECTHRSEHDGIAFAKQAAVGAAHRAVEIREAVCEGDGAEADIA